MPISVISQFENKSRKASFFSIAYFTHWPSWFYCIYHSLVIHLSGVTAYTTKQRYTSLMVRCISQMEVNPFAINLSLTK